MKKFLLALVTIFVATVASAQDVQALPPLEKPADAEVVLPPIEAPANSKVETQVQIRVGTPAPLAPVAPAPAATTAVVAAEVTTTEGLFDLIYTQMITTYGFQSRIGYTSAAAHLAMCTVLGNGNALNIAQRQIEAMKSILYHITRATYVVRYPNGAVRRMFVFGQTLPQTQARIAAILACKQGGRSNAQMVQELIAYGQKLPIGGSVMDMTLGYNWEAAAMMMPTP